MYANMHVQLAFNYTKFYPDGSFGHCAYSLNTTFENHKTKQIIFVCFVHKKCLAFFIDHWFYVYSPKY